MRDNGEPLDEIALSLRHDDVDKFQNITSMSNIDILTSVIPYNIYEFYVKNGETNYLDYAAAYGSIRCFKYLLLNHAVMSIYTKSYAIHGGNNEIIQIAHQQIAENPKTNKRTLRSFSEVTETNRCIQYIIPSITKHRNDIFDWATQSYYNDLNAKSSHLITFSLENGNIHSFVETIIKNYCSFNSKNILCWLLNAAKNGFYRLILFIYNVFKQKLQNLSWRKMTFCLKDCIELFISKTFLFLKFFNYF